MTTADKRTTMRRAVRYRSGPGFMNEVYLGGLATTHMMHIFGSSATQAARDKKSLIDLIDEATDRQIEEANDYEGYQWILGHYRKAGSKLHRYNMVPVEID